jgi:hypothetical protein
LWLEDKLSFQRLFSDFLLSWSDLERENESLRRGKKKKSLGTLKLGSAHVALAVQYNPPSGVQVPSDCLPYRCNGLRAFPQFPKGEILLNKVEREREKVDLRVPP